MVMIVIMVMLMMSTAAVLLMVMIVIMVMFMMSAAAVLLMVVIVIMVMLMMSMTFFILEQPFDLCSCMKCMLDCFFSKLIPRCGNNCCLLILFTQHLYTIFYFLICHHLCTADNDCRSMLYLILKELAKILQIHLSFLTINDRNSSFDLDICIFLHVFDCSCYIG